MTNDANSAPKPPFFPDDIQFWYETKRAFGSSSYGGSEFGEVMATVSHILPGNFDSWYDAWNATAERVASAATEQLARGHRISARDGFLRASTYYRTSEFFLHGNPADPRIKSAYEKSIHAYKTCAALFDPPILPVEIPYEHTTLPGYFHRVDNSNHQRPLLIIHSGFDGAAEEVHMDGARAAVDRGYNVLAFDGPGQFGPLHREHLTFRPDWENVLTPVINFALTLPEVDPAKIALMGISLGGYLAPRAAAFEKRISAVIANDGVYDYGVANMSAFPPEQRAAAEIAVRAKDAPQIDRAIAQAMKNSPTAAWAMTHGMHAFGAPTPRAYVAASLDYNLRNGIAESISCPTLVCEAEDDMFFKGQPQELYNHLVCPKTLMRFTDSEGAGAHCQVGAARLAFGRMYDWLDQTFRLAVPA
ncbi:alpha/beta hydrolase family protein [Terracidiphilus gabretensis]|uniref:alpha/beta hydrolase family protein n=1 Tax=Terracidiphilus gabretensis TaxID=1577687 RepID=UPI00071BA72C|nr:alpha/beta fold hydrolase [Terracidiphilus gabretensis]